MNPVLQTTMKFLIRRGLTMLGTAGATVSDDWVTQTASLVVVGLNEAVQWFQAHKAAKEAKDAELLEHD